MTNTDLCFDMWTVRKIANDDFGQDHWHFNDHINFLNRHHHHHHQGYSSYDADDDNHTIESVNENDNNDNYGSGYDNDYGRGNNDDNYYRGDNNDYSDQYQNDQSLFFFFLL